uniref:DIS3-like exonuclease 2 n=1 Tax=Kalanchoe fedtschenkoi TaxID=63787 RepID=A0A7N0TLZ8_KALFE
MGEVPFHSDKKKKRRSRRSKNISGLPCPSLDHSPHEQSDCLNHGSPLAGTTPAVLYDSCSLPAMDTSGLPHLSDVTASQNQYNGSTSFAFPHLAQDLSSRAAYSLQEKGYVPINQFKDRHQKIFTPHWSLEATVEALNRGNAFKAVFRTNVHNRVEAYCKIDGVPVDILINGIASQNRAVEGDIVAIEVDPLSCWTNLKGTTAQSITSASSGSCMMAADVSEKVNLAIVEHGVNCVNIYNGESSGHGEGFSCQLFGNNVQMEVVESVSKICYDICSSPLKRPTGKVVAILEKSTRRDSIVGCISTKKWVQHVAWYKSYYKKSILSLSELGYIELMPANLKFPKMVVPVGNLPDAIQKRLIDGDITLEREIVAAKIDSWQEDDPFPMARIINTFGRAGEIDTHVNSILFENNICCSEFSAESLSCLPGGDWSIPPEELENREDLRRKCIFTIDPPTATDLDDALSFENLSNGNFRIGVHIADVSYFVPPDSALDREAQERATSVYMLQWKLPMLPPLLSEDIVSLNPGVDRLAFSIFWEISPDGVIFNWWIGRTVIHSCCKLSYALAQDIIDLENPDTAAYPCLHANVEWAEVIRAVKNLHRASKKLKEKRFVDGALRLDSPKLSYLFDDFGVPYDGMMSKRYDANFLVEEFMLLANRTVAEVISRAYPDNVLLRRHPEPNPRKLKEFKAFCCKHGFDVDISSSGHLHQSLERIKQKTGDDAVLFDIIVNYATKSMQLAAYFCSGDQKIPVHEWGHYALAVPLYTHFTSPLRRYPDIVVHRTLAAAIEAELIYSKEHPGSTDVNVAVKRCFTGASFDKSAADSILGKEALSAAALKHKLLQAESLTEVAGHCNERKIASKAAEDACHRLYMWVLLKNKQFLVSEARVLGLGPKFMSIYIQKLAIERRIYYDEVEGLQAEWLDATSTLVLSFSHKRLNRKGTPSKWRPLEEVALVVNPADSKSEDWLGANENCSVTSRNATSGKSPNYFSLSDCDVEPPLLPVTVHMFSMIPIAIYAVSGEDRPLEIEARLYVSSYFG